MACGMSWHTVRESVREKEKKLSDYISYVYIYTHTKKHQMNEDDQR